MKSWRLLGIGAAGLLVILLAWLLRDVVYRFLVVPIQYIGWIFHSLYLSLPHELIWGLFLIVAYMIALTSLYRRPKAPEQTFSHASRSAEMRISQLARYLSRRKSTFYKHRIKYALTDLALQVITQKKRITLQELRSLVNQRELDVPPEFLSYFKEGLLPWTSGSIQPPGLLQRIVQFRTKQKEADDLSMQVLAYIEEQMEIEQNGNIPSL